MFVRGRHPSPPQVRDQAIQTLLTVGRLDRRRLSKLDDLRIPSAGDGSPAFGQRRHAVGKRDEAVAFRGYVVHSRLT